VAWKEGRRRSTVAMMVEKVENEPYESLIDKSPKVKKEKMKENERK